MPNRFRQRNCLRETSRDGIVVVVSVWSRPGNAIRDSADVLRCEKVNQGTAMTTRRVIKIYWMEVKRIVNGEVKQTTCCCADPGMTAKECQAKSGNKTRCRCDCHRNT